MNPIKNNSGFTMVEVLVAAVLLVLGLIMFIMLTGNVIGQNTKSTKESVATSLAQDKIEEIKNTALTVSLEGADSLDSPAYSSSWSATTGGEVIDSEGDTGTSDAIYTRTWTITAHGTLYYYYTIVANVSWENGANTVTLTSQLSQ